jgi:uncharacterized protein YggE
MNWQIMVENKGPKLQVVTSQHTKQVTLVLEVLGTFNLDSEKIQTTGMNFGEEWRYRSGTRVKEGYRASTHISFSMKDFKSYQALWSKLAELNDVSVQSVSYDYSLREEAQSQLRVEALLNAKTKANQLVKALGSKVGEPLHIEEGAQNRPIFRTSSFKARDAVSSAGPSISRGQIELRTEVAATFLLINP